MVELNFIESLKAALDRLEIVNKQNDALTLEKEELRTKIRKWLDMHHLTDFESYNTDKSALWQMSISQRKKQTIDKDLLKSLVSEPVYKQIITETEYEVLTIKTAKHSKSSKSGGAIPAPKGTI